MLRRSLISFLLLFCSMTLGAAELPPLGEQASGWAASLGHGAVATAEKRDGRWTFAIAGQPFAAGHAAVPPQEVLFEIGSITKVFTGILLADAVKDGKLGLDDTLAQRLPVKFDHSDTGAVTLKQLATHTSCLPRLPDNMMNAGGDDPYAQYDKKAMFEYLASARLADKPPCTPEYSNLGFGILGVVLETAYGKPWAALIQEKITGPLGMADTVQNLSPAQQSRFAEPWDGDHKAHPWTFMAVAGAGALRSSLAEMSKLADALLAGSKGPLGNVWPLLAGDHTDMPAVGGKIGLGLIHAKANGEESYSHDGGTGGFRSTLSVRPASGRAVVVLASNAAANPGAWLAAWEAKGRQPASRSEVTLPAEVLDEYVGVYSIDKSARFTLIRRGDGLVARLTGQPFFPVFASAKDEFFYKVVDAQLSFHRNAGGKIAGLTLHQNGRDIPATRDTLPVPHVEFPNAAALAEYAGEYDFGQFQPGATITVQATPAGLLVTLTGQPALPVFGVGKDRFDYDVVTATLTFERDPAGKVVAVVLHQNGMDMKAPKR
ncbi:MAG TPA: serine hydrolase [Thermoanaerobaculia bacterium]|jgi:CubicO group peptidase (beta-lactamase class C family)|nr:serine hydrolase [Thermoanaerobaculia bacterium]